MNTTITEYQQRPCTKCGGKGFLSAFTHRKGGECFRCGTTGNDPVMMLVTRDMTDIEVVAELGRRGFDVISFEIPQTDNWLADLFPSAEEQTRRAEMMAGARIMLAGLAG